ncbi:MAG: transketolase family protein [Actinobacteria bacterium]|nr:transketolase family protein [Actinomycetota bacterium]
MARPPGKALRQVFGEVLSELAGRDARLLVLDGDVASSTGAELFEARHPERFLQMGIAEQNMLGVAAGLATVGFVPVISAFACFAVGRAFDSIRVLVAQPALNVKIAGGYVGLLTASTGKTHQMFNDVAIMRSLANVTVLAPADEAEARQAIEAMVSTDGPFYLQVAREPSPQLFGPDYRFQLGRAVRLRDGADVTLVSTGVETTRVVEAAEMLATRGVQATVLHLPTIKPIDADALVDAAIATGLVVVVEEQNVVGGLGGAVAEVLSDRHPVTVKRLGIADTYGESGSNEALLDKYRLSASRVAEDVESLVARGSSHAADEVRATKLGRVP